MRYTAYDDRCQDGSPSLPGLLWGRQTATPGAYDESSHPWTLQGILNPYRSARSIVILAGVVLVSVVILDWMFPSGTRATLVGTEGADRTVPKLARAILLCVMFLYVIATGWDPGAYGFSTGRALAVFGVYMLISVFFCPGDWGPKFVVATKSLLWILIAIGGYRLTLGGYLSATDIRCLAGVVVAIAATYTIGYCLLGDYRRGTNANVEVLLWCIPLLLLTDPPPWASALAGLASLAAIMTCKRSALLALVVGGCAHVVGLRVISPHREACVKHVVALILLTAALCGAVAWQWENIANKMADFDDPEAMGSGRGWFYRAILSEWYDSEAFGLLFGRGFLTVPDTLEAYGVAIIAHSDWLEILHDMGFFGVFLFAYLNVRLLSLQARAMHWRLAILPPLMMGFSIFVVRSLISGCVVASVENVYFGLLLGYGAACITVQTATPPWVCGDDCPGVNQRTDREGGFDESPVGNA